MIAESDFREKVSQLLSQENFVVPHDLMHRQNLESSTEKKFQLKTFFSNILSRVSSRIVASHKIFFMYPDKYTPHILMRSSTICIRLVCIC